MAARAHVEIRMIVAFHGFAFRPAGAQPGVEPYDLAGGVNVPMLVLHGTEHERAPMADMRRMEARMRAQDAAKQSFDEARRFLARYLPRVKGDGHEWRPTEDSRSG